MKYFLVVLLPLFPSALGAQYAPPATYSIQNAKGADAVAALEALGANARQSYIETYKEIGRAHV